MPFKKLGEQSIYYEFPPVIKSSAAIVGPEEGKGPLEKNFDLVLEKNMYREKTPEKAEMKMLLESCNLALKKAGIKSDDIDFFMAGDLLNQIIAANFTARELALPFFGLYGACSTFSEALILSSMLIDGNFAHQVLMGVSSHYETAERQFRYPIELNIKKSQTAQYTVTGAGSCIVSDQEQGEGVKIINGTVGKVIDMGIKKADQLGSGMAPAAADTIVQHFKDMDAQPSDYDLILTGDLGKVGQDILRELVKKDGYDISNNHQDCGVMIFDFNKQKVGAGGSGCGCSAVVTLGYMLKEMEKNNYQHVLVVSTGALHSPLSCNQGETIPAVAHAVLLGG